jgi:hypothetical protein
VEKLSSTDFSNVDRTRSLPSKIAFLQILEQWFLGAIPNRPFVGGVSKHSGEIITHFRQAIELLNLDILPHG